MFLAKKIDMPYADFWLALSALKWILKTILEDNKTNVEEKKCVKKKERKNAILFDFQY